METIWVKLLKKISGYIETLKQLFLVALFVLFRSLFHQRQTLKQGYLRGYDFYSKLTFFRTLANAMKDFKKVHKVYPNLISPKKFSEKVFWFKFFGQLKVPEAGNKLLTSRFIPTHLKSKITCPEIVWHSVETRLPRNHQITPGSYYLKANHGSGAFKKIDYPMTDSSIAELEKICKQWLSYPYGLDSGEWWYNCFNKEILIEKSVCNDNGSISWGFFVFKGEIGFVIMVKKTDESTQINWLDKDFKLMEHQSTDYSRISEYQLPANIEYAKELCSQIGKEIGFVRVDLLMDANEKFYLGEMTFSPGNALTLRPDEMEWYLGNLWKKPL